MGQPKLGSGMNGDNRPTSKRSLSVSRPRASYHRTRGNGRTRGSCSTTVSKNETTPDPESRNLYPQSRIRNHAICSRNPVAGPENGYPPATKETTVNKPEVLV